MTLDQFQQPHIPDIQLLQMSPPVPWVVISIFTAANTIAQLCGLLALLHTGWHCGRFLFKMYFMRTTSHRIAKLKIRKNYPVNSTHLIVIVEHLGKKGVSLFLLIVRMTLHDKWSCFKKVMRSVLPSTNFFILCICLKEGKLRVLLRMQERKEQYCILSRLSSLLVSGVCLYLAVENKIWKQTGYVWD